MPTSQDTCQAHPLPPGIVGALGIGGYQLLADVAGVGAGRLGPAGLPARRPRSRPEPARTPAPRSRCTTAAEGRGGASAAFTQLAAQLGYMRLSGYRLALERHGLRSKVGVLNPATGAIVGHDPDKHPGGLLSAAAATAPPGCWPECGRCRRPGRRRTSRTPS